MRGKHSPPGPAGPDADIGVYRERLRTWFRTSTWPHLPDDPDRRFAVLQDWQHRLYRAGFIGIHWPQEYGGQGLTALHHLVFYQELAAARAPSPIGLIGLDVVGPSILEFGDDEQKARFLPPLLSGREIWCQGFSEPEAGSDLAAVRTLATLDNDRFVLSGQKIWTSWAHKARWCAVLARTDKTAPKHEGISYLLVDMESPGVSVRPIRQMTGDDEFNEVFFDDVSVPRHHLLGRLNDGWRIAMNTLGHERGFYTLRRSAEHAAAFDVLLDALAGRRLPDRTVERIGASYVALQALEAQTRHTVHRIAEGQGPTPLDSIDKLLLTGVEQQIYGDALDLLGPGRTVGTTTGPGLDGARWIHDYLYSRAASIYGGTSQIQRNIIAERHLGLPR